MSKRANDIKQALAYSVREIQELRDINGRLAIKAQAFEAMAGLVRLLAPQGGGCMTQDRLWNVRELLAEIEAEEKGGKDGSNPSP